MYAENHRGGSRGEDGGNVELPDRRHTAAPVLETEQCSSNREPVVEMRDQAYRICRDYLSGSWKSISSSDMVFRSVRCTRKPLSNTWNVTETTLPYGGGMSNLLYYCSLPETHTPLVGEPDQVLLRMYGQIHDGTESTVTESVIFMMLSERNLGPKLYGIFPGGRLEEYIPARAMTCDELKDPDVSTTIARKLAKVHSLNVPINKEPTWLFDRMSRWLSFARSEVSVENLDSSKNEVAQYLLSYDLEGELNWLKNFLPEAGSPVLFCHNDLQEGNILIPEGAAVSEDKVVFIDFEYCSYNFRGFDIANHFCEWCFDYCAPEYPHFSAKLEAFPTVDQQLYFIRSYLSSSEGTSQQNDAEKEVNSEQHILQEVEYFTLASHFLWTLWSIVNAHNSQISFGYWEYGKTRLNAYIKYKQQFLSKQLQRKLLDIP